jgi:uncharacterized protein YggU (UPF0235/DUF167 family)
MDETTQKAITDAVKAAMDGIHDRLDNIEQNVIAIRSEGAVNASVTRALARKLLAPEELAGLNLPG